MAVMLEALDLHRGQKVLEIGTGTGYNTALLCHLVGDASLVTSVDIEAILTREAAPRVMQVAGASANIITADGHLGCPEQAPYDRMIVTASTPSIPVHWISQLADGGKIICILQPHGPIGGVLVAERHNDTFVGSLLRSASFLFLRHQPGEGHEQRTSFRFAPSLRSAVTYTCPDLWDGNLQFFLYNSIPDLQMLRRMLPERGNEVQTILFQQHEEDGYLVIGEQMVELRGIRSPRLWRLLWQTLLAWDALQHPSISEYWYQYPDGLFLDQTPGRIWPFA
jgi:protein-L-isoaspartate O-methyltransferase